MRMFHHLELPNPVVLTRDPPMLKTSTLRLRLLDPSQLRKLLSLNLRIPRKLSPLGSHLFHNHRPGRWRCWWMRSL